MKQNEFVINKNNYETEEQFWNAVAGVMKLLTDNGYVCVFKEEDCGFYMFEYGFTDRSLGGAYPIWLTEDEEVFLDKTE